MGWWASLCDQFAPEQSIQHESNFNDFLRSLPWQLPTMREPPPAPHISTSLANSLFRGETQEWLSNSHHVVTVIGIAILTLFLALLFAYPPIHSRLPHTLALFHDRTAGRVLALIQSKRNPVIIKQKLPRRPPRPPRLSPQKLLELRKDGAGHATVFDNRIRLFESLALGSSTILRDLERCSIEDLVDEFSLLCHSLSATPPWMHWFRDRAADIIKERADKSPDLQQCIFSTSASASKETKDLFSDVPKCPDGPRICRSLFALKRGVGSKIHVGPDETLMHPFRPNFNVGELEVVKIFDSNSRPLLVKLKARDSCLEDHIIVKCGDDLRRDVAVMDTFRYVNKIWQSDAAPVSTITLTDGGGTGSTRSTPESSETRPRRKSSDVVPGESDRPSSRRQSSSVVFNSDPIHTKVYRCYAMSQNLGAIEFVHNCQPLHKIANQDFDAAEVDRMISSAAGSYIASWVLGIRDRHHDNIQVTEDGVIFHIDFSHMFGQKVSIDTAEFAITKDLQTVLGDLRWVKFINRAVEGFLALRNRSEDLIPFVTLVFSPLFKPRLIESFLRSSLMLDVPQRTAIERLTELLSKAPRSVRTKLKNAIHRRASRLKASPRERTASPRSRDRHSSWSIMASTPSVLKTSPRDATASPRARDRLSSRSIMASTPSVLKTSPRDTTASPRARDRLSMSSRSIMASTPS